MGAFGNHRSGGGGGDFLKNWKANKSIEVWLSVRELPIAMWRHSLPKIQVIEDRTTKSKIAHIWSQQVVCHESEAVLNNQYRRDDDGTRKTPPKRCGLCKLNEWAFQQAWTFEENRETNMDRRAKGKPEKGIEFTTPIFKFEGDVMKETQVLHIGGICGIAAKPEKMDDAMKAALAKAKLTELWKENLAAKTQYVMCVVSNAQPDAGVQIAVQTGGLGEKVQSVMNEMMEDKKRNYEQKPYCIRWSYDEKAMPADMYKARALDDDDYPLTARIKKLIEGPVPTEAIDALIKPYNQQTMRAFLEEHCLLPKGTVPWDELFPSAAQEKSWNEEDAQAEAENGSDVGRASGSSTDVGDDDDDDDADEEETFECDNEKCKQPVKASDTECAACGMKFDVEALDAAEPEPPPPPPPPAKLKTRAEALREKKAAKGGKDDQDGEIPF